MRTEAVQLISSIYNAYTAYDVARFDRQNFYHLFLSLFAWKLISEVPFKTSPVIKKQLPLSVSFDQTMANIDEKNFQEKIQKALLECEKCTPDWHGLWILNQSVFDDLSYEKWLSLASLWENFIVSTSNMEKHQVFAALATELESWMVSDLREFSDITPAGLINVMVDSLKEYPGQSLYDPFCRSGNFLFAAAKYNKQLKYISGFTPGILFRKFAELRMLLLEDKTHTSIKKISEESTSLSIKYDKIISNPPFGSQNTYYELETDREWIEFTKKSKRTDVAFLCHALSMLSDTGHAAILLPAIFLSGNGIIGELIKRIVEKNLLDSVIEMPQGMFTHTTIPVVLFIFSKTRETNTEILLLDASREIQKNGKLIRLNEENLKDTINKIHKGGHIKGENFCLVSRHAIETKKYDLRCLSYRKKTIMPNEIVSSEKLLQECEKLEADLAQLRKNIIRLVSSKK